MGALYVRRKPRVRLEAQMHGGGHERGFRSGTLATHQIVGMGECMQIAGLEMAAELPRLRAWRDKLHRGLRGYVSGALVGAGLSSSASVGLAYLKALADVNSLDVIAEELVWLDFQLENGQLGLQNGILDPMTIVHGKKDALLWMDTVRGTFTPIPDPELDTASWIVVYSGIPRELTKSGYNIRVAECREAATMLHPGARKLSDIPHELFKEKRASLPGNLCRRAEHFYTEVERVQQGAQAWKESDLEKFGSLMNQSCASSINNYESGSPVLVELHQIASNTAGVYGSRFSGGSYSGCVVALANDRPSRAKAHPAPM